jgi:hypothetical protein
MQELINRTSGLVDSLFSSALDALYLASYLGLSYLALSMATGYVSRLMPHRTAVPIPHKEFRAKK